MKIGAMYSHLNGFEWIMYHKPHLWEELKTVIETIDANQHKTKVSDEKTMKGKMKFAPKTLNQAFKDGLNPLGWNKSNTYYWVTDDYDLMLDSIRLQPSEQKRKIKDSGKNPIDSYNEVDFVKEEVAIEVQFGKYSFVAYDLNAKHLSFYISGKIKVGIEIVPMKSMQKEMSSGPPYYEKVLFELASQGRGVPAVPLVLIGLEP